MPQLCLRQSSYVGTNMDWGAESHIGGYDDEDGTCNKDWQYGELKTSVG